MSAHFCCNMRKKILASLGLVLFCSLLCRGDQKSVYQEYVRKYSRVAVAEMYRSGVPASITLAQGLLESGAGKSRLATEGNNHFGIKCHNWTGGKMYHDDDRKGECFRKYSSADESFRDHSDFLRYKDRYAFLFNLDPTDYEGWAYGLKKAGYATDPSYPSKLIKLIKDYNLSQYDTFDASYGAEQGYTPEESSSEESQVANDSTSKENVGKGEKASKKNSKKSDKSSKKTRKVTRPESPTALETPQKLSGEQREVFSFNLSRELYSQNGVPFVYSVDGETYSSIAKQYNLFPREILKFNDLSADSEIAPGTVVYLQAKKSRAAKGLDKHVWESGDDLWKISQRYGVRLSSLKKMNKVKSNSDIAEGDLIILRK